MINLKKLTTLLYIYYTYIIHILYIYNRYIIDIMALQNILNTYVPLRANINNNDNGKVKLGCVAFNPKITHQCVLRVWP